jgi:plastocyanin
MRSGIIFVATTVLLATATVAAGEGRVVVTREANTPATIEVAVGEEVVWMKASGGVAHIAFAGNDAVQFYVGGKDSRVKFTQPGTCDYFVHLSGGIKMQAHRGKVIVKAAQVNGRTSRAVTVQELFALNHRLAVPAGTRVAWADPHFERVWFPTSGPAVVRQDGVLTTLFETPGEYHGRFTVTAGHATTDVYTITVVVGALQQ